MYVYKNAFLFTIIISALLNFYVVMKYFVIYFYF